MHAPEIPKFDLQRAVAVLNKAGEHNMLPDGWQMPESDADKITEAERIVTLSRQAQQVMHAVGEEAFKAQGGHADGITAVLFEANVTGGSTPVNGQPEQQPEASQANPSPPAEPSSIEEAVKPSPEEQANRGVLMEAAGVAPEVKETWFDDNGQQWVIDNVGAGGVEAHPPGDEDKKTILPIGFLKTKVGSPSTSPQEQPPPSSSPTQASASSSASGQAQSTTIVPPTPSPASAAASQQQPASSSASSSDVLDDDDEGDQEYAGLLEQVRRDYERANLPLPKDIEQPPEMVEDLTLLQDVHQRKLHSAFNACASRARYLMGLERGKALNCKRVAKKYLKPVMSTARTELGAAASLTEVQQKAEEDERVQLWLRRQERHEDRRDALRDLFEIYSENVTVLSRDWTMRGKEEAGS